VTRLATRLRNHCITLNTKFATTCRFSEWCAPNVQIVLSEPQRSVQVCCTFPESVGRPADGDARIVPRRQAQASGKILGFPQGDPVGATRTTWFWRADFQLIGPQELGPRVENDSSSTIWKVDILVGNVALGTYKGLQPIPPRYTAPSGWTVYGAFSGSIADPPYNENGGFYEWYGGSNVIQPGAEAFGKPLLSLRPETGDLTTCFSTAARELWHSGTLSCLMGLTGTAHRLQWALHQYQQHSRSSPPASVSWLYLAVAESERLPLVSRPSGLHSAFDCLTLRWQRETGKPTRNKPLAPAAPMPRAEPRQTGALFAVPSSGWIWNGRWPDLSLSVKIEQRAKQHHTRLIRGACAGRSGGREPHRRTRPRSSGRGDKAAKSPRASARHSCARGGRKQAPCLAQLAPRHQYGTSVRPQ
jgi:hypothetical protein